MLDSYLDSVDQHAMCTAYTWGSSEVVHSKCHERASHGARVT